MDQDATRLFSLRRIPPFRDLPDLCRSMLLRWGVLIVLLCAEIEGYFSYKIRFSAAGVFNAGKLGPFWYHVGWYLPAILASPAAFLLFVSPRLRQIIRSMARYSYAYLWWPWLFPQLAAVILYALCSRELFEGRAHSIGWLFAKDVLALASTALWLCAFAPPRFWRELARAERIPLLVAALFGCAGCAVWASGRLLWNPLAEVTLRLVHLLLAALYHETIILPAERIIGTASFQVWIGPSCSGYEGIGLITLFSVVYLWLFRARIRLPHALLLIPLGAVAEWLANILRIAALISIGTSISPEVAVGGFHSQAGWIFFLFVTLGGLIAASKRSGWFCKLEERTDSPAGHPAEASEAAVLLTPLLALLAAIIVTSAFSGRFDWFYPIRVLATLGALWRFRGFYRRLDWSWSWWSVAIGAAVFVFWVWLEPLVKVDGSNLETGLAQMPGAAAALWLVFRVAGSVVTVPLAEELAFRGYVIRKTVSSDLGSVRPGQFTWFSFALSSVLFGVMHGRWLAGTLAGMCYAIALYRRGRISDAVYAHMTTNALLSMYLLWFREWSFWS